MPGDFTRQQRVSRWERCNWSYPPSFCLNSFPPGPATLLILFCLMPVEFTCQGRAFGCERVEGYRGIELSASVLQIFVCL